MSHPNCIAVVGAGLAGLATATYLGRAGHRVVLLDAARAPGGRARTESVDGYQLNLGAHALYQGGAAARVLKELGIGYHGRAPKLHAAKALVGEHVSPLPVGLISLLKASVLGARGRYELARFLASPPGADDPLLMTRSVASWLDEHFTHPLARGMAETFVRLATYAASSQTLSADAARAQLCAVSGGVLYLDGGWQTLVDGLVTEARRARADFRFGSPVRTLEHDGSNMRGVRVGSGELIEAEQVVYAAPLHLLPALLADDASARAVASHERVHTACLELGASNPGTLMADLVLGVGVPLYASLHSAAAKLAAAGSALVHTVKYLGRGETTGSTEDRAALRGLASLMLPDTAFELERYRPSLMVHQDLPTASRGGLSGRTAVRHATLSGLYFAGDSVGTEGMLADSALASAREAARLCLTEAGTRRASVVGGFARVTTSPAP